MPAQLENHQYEETIKDRIEKAKEKRSRAYVETIASVRNSDEKIVERQNNILKEMPDFKNLSRILKAGLKASSVENPQSTVPDKYVIQGILFEELVKIENDLYDLSSGNTKPKQIENNFSDQERGRVELRADEQLTILLHNPDRFNYSEISHLRNPDLSFVETDVDGKTLKVVGVGEAKSSYKLDKRCFLQFKYFHQNLEKVADFINVQTDSEEHGLKNFGVGEGKSVLKVNSEENFKQYLIVTSDMAVDPEKPRNNFKMIGDGSLSEHDAQVFESLIKQNKVTIIKSSFSHQELDQIVAKVEKIISEDLRLEELEFKAEQEAV